MEYTLQQGDTLPLDAILQPLKGAKRKYILYRIVGISPEASRDLCNIKKSSMTTWLHDAAFVQVNNQVIQLSQTHKQEAIKLLRRETQVAAIMLESSIIDKMRGEIESGDYNLIKTRIAHEVYSKLINELDISPIPKSLTWEQKIAAFFVDGGKNEHVEADYIEETEPPESQLITQGQ
jgi:hypothetical protein